jgi:apolipoprotein D and lipocalin family protein
MTLAHHSLLALICLCAFSASAQADNNPTPAPLSTIATLNVPRYLGTWYEIAKYPNWFQKKCVANTNANYQLKSDGSLEVVNRCQLKNGEVSTAIGNAKQIGLAASAKLKVRFAPAWLSFIPAVWGDYWVIDLDDHYQVAVVSEPKREYLWILSRTPSVDAKVYAELLARLGKQGFDLSKLEMTKQDK